MNARIADLTALGFLADDELPDGRQIHNGTPRTVPGRPVGAYAVTTVDRDGQVVDGAVCVEVGTEERNLTLDEARAFACAVTAAADDLLAANPTHPLDVVSTVAIWDEIARRVTGPGALRAAIAAADPAALTREDRAALMNLLGRAFDAAESK